jgi:hypothetical protein
MSSLTVVQRHALRGTCTAHQLGFEIFNIGLVQLAGTGNKKHGPGPKVFFWVIEKSC